MLLDEFGAGTDPSQGAALAQAVLDGISEKGAHAVAATHFPALKTYALTREGVRAATVLFDEKTGRPLYRLAYDQVGASLALTVAREHGLPASVLEKAQHYLLQGSSDIEKIVSDLNALAVRREEELADLRLQQKKTEEKKQKLQERFDRESRRLKEEIETMSREIMKSWREDKASAKQAAKELLRLRESLAAEEAKPSVKAGDITVGCEVVYSQWGKKGKILEIDEKAAKAKIDLGGIGIWAPFGQLSPSQEMPKPRKTSSESVSFTSGRRCYSVDVRGKRADEAIAEIQQFLDNALMNNLEEIEIIHGRGTGALRKKIHEFLRGYPGIASFAVASEDRGGDGMTVVGFK